MSAKKILIVEDDANLLKLIGYTLEKAGYACTRAETGGQAQKLLSSQSFDLVVLDLMLPEVDGLELCRQIRKDERISRLPVVMLTAKGEEVDRVVGFEIGADDYMVKPFSPRELVLRVKAVLKRAEPQPIADGEIVRTADIEIDPSRHRVVCRGKEIELTLTEYKLLNTLVCRRGRVQSRDTLLSDVWEIEADITTRTIDTHIKRLRQKLGPVGEKIDTIRGVGYRFSEDSPEN